MTWQAGLAIYVLVWVMSAFLVMPFEARRRSENDMPMVAGQERGAPPHLSLGRVAVRTTVLATVLFGLFLANYINGWLTPAMLDVTRL